jgi:phosphoadenosine phosphosulfate reductase
MTIETKTESRVEARAIDEASARLRGAAPEDILRWGLERFGARLANASSFSIEDFVVNDNANRVAKELGAPLRVFALDTGRLPEETYLTAERVIAKYGIPIEWQFPDRIAVERLLQAKGLFSFRDSLDNRHECCGIRKVEPLGRMLVTLDAWVTGLRREQSITRTEAHEVEHDSGYGGMAKLNPIIGWSTAEVRAYAEGHKVPIHPLHEKGYPSIGCAPCTRAVAPGEHPRAGRWWWENPENKECGLHVR